ncbi:MAG TPA: UdgX family uracil-DNA binding protein, partial [Sphingobium sp.]
WRVEGSEDDLFATEAPQPKGATFPVPRPFVDLARSVVCHSDPERFALFYAMLWKLRSNRHAMEDRADPLVDRLQRLAKEVRRDVHKMHAFVRFREVGQPDATTRFIAFFEPDHHIVRHTAGFFVRRFTNMRWSILTPELSIHWDGASLKEGPGAKRTDAPDGDPVEDIWRSYYAATFNPARLKQRAMLSEMPRKYWRNLPEAALIPDLIAGAQAREATMIAAPPKAPSLRGDLTGGWAALRAEAMACTRCPLYQDATQTVFGEGPLTASLVLVGEQPGDQEDIAGRPFVGPAGQLLDKALEEAEIDRKSIYLTNAVKHFKYERRGKRRIHQTPQTPEIQACRWWLEQELDLVRPRIIVALGATAAHAMLGKPVTINRTRGAPIALESGVEGWVTVHPSFLLRIPDEARKTAERARLVEELRELSARIRALDKGAG